MPRVSPLLASFNAGELAPVMDGRVDMQKYPTACKKLENFIVIPQGAFIKRGGTKFAATVKDSSYAPFLKRFRFSITQAYVLEFGNLYMRVFKDNGIVTLTATNITAATKANPCVVTAAAHGLNNGEKVWISGVVGMGQINNREFTVANKTANTIELSGVNSTAYDTYTSGGTVAKIYEIATPWSNTEVRAVEFTQSNDVLYASHPDFELRKISRTGHTAWTIGAADLKDGPWTAQNTVVANTVTPSATVGSANFTAINDSFVASDVGRLITTRNTGDPNFRGHGKITALTTAKIVVATIPEHIDYKFGNTTGSYQWMLGLYGTVNGYPRACCFFEDRLWLGGCNGAPQRVDGSVSGEYERFSPDVMPRQADGTGAWADTAHTARVTDPVITDDMAVAFQVLANDVNVIRWMMDDEKGLLVGTAGAEWSLRTSSNQAAVAATNPPAARRVSNHGCANVSPVRADRAVVFVTRDGERVHEFAYVYESDGYATPDLTLLASHIGKGGITQLSYEAKPHSVVWAVRGDGQLLGLTYQRDQDVVAWHRHIVGGYSDSGQTAAAIVESVASIPSADGTRDETWLVVKRYINGATVRTIEYMTETSPTVDVPADCVRADMAFVYDGAAATTVHGLWQLEGQTVTILADGAVLPTQTVTNGKVTLANAASKILIGLAYSAKLQTMRIEAGSADGTAQAKKKRIHSLVLRVLDTRGGKAGPSFAAIQTIPELNARLPSTPMGTASPLKTGDTEKIIFEGGYETDGHICIQHDDPLPMTVVAMMPQLQTNDR